MNALKCRTFAAMMLLRLHTSQHKQPTLKSTSLSKVWAFFPHQLGFVSLQNLLISDIDMFTLSQWTKPKKKASKIQKLAFQYFLLTSAKVKKLSWRPNLHCDFSATKKFFFQKLISVQFTTG